MAGRVIQGFFPGGRPHVAAHVLRSPFMPVQAVQPKGMLRLPGPPAPAFISHQPVAQAKAILRQPGPPAPAFAPRSPTVQAQGANETFQVDSGRLGLMSGGGKPLPDTVRGQMEAALGADFSAVRVHVGPQAERIGAIAFTTGNDLYFAPGRFQPDTIQGKQLLGHELAHVVQQRQNRVRNPLGAGVAVVQDRMLEAEADRLGILAASLQPPATQWMPALKSARPTNRLRPDTIQQVKIPDTHDLDDAKKYVRWREYSLKPETSNQGHRVGTCYICRKKERMRNMQIDHIVPANFLRALLDLWKIYKDVAVEIACALQLNWKFTKKYDYDATNALYTSYRDKFDNVDKKSTVKFTGKIYEILQDVGNLALICTQCNAKNVKTDKLLEVDYKALQKNYGTWNKPGQQAILANLSKWIGTNYYIRPSTVVPDYGTPPNSPGQAAPNVVLL